MAKWLKPSLPGQRTHGSAEVYDDGMLMAFLIAIASGLIMPIQASINNRLRMAVGSPFIMSLISFTVGLATMTLLVVLVDRRIGFPVGLISEVPWWYWLGGPMGVVGMTLAVVLLPKIGAVEMTIWNLSGQILTGVVIDHFGFFNAVIEPATPLRLLGVVLILSGAIGVVLAGSPRGIFRSRGQLVNTQVGRSPSQSAWFWRMIGFVVVGGFFATQIAVNGKLAEVTQSGFLASQASFSTGVLTLLLIVAVLRPSLQLDRPASGRNPWWMWFGGVLGSLYVAGSAFMAPIIGAGTTIMFIQAGMLAGSLLVDHFGIASAPVKKVVPLQLVFMILLASGLVLAQ